MQSEKFMGLDFGNSRIGIALSDDFGSIAFAHSVVLSQGKEADIKFLSKFAKENNVSSIVLGLPLNADGSESDMSKIVKEFGRALEDFSQITVFFQDERYTSFEAEEYLKEAKIKWQDRKKLLDKISAQIILQNYLDENKLRKGEKNG